MAHFTLTNDPVGGPVLTAVIAVSQARGQALQKAGQTIPKVQSVRALVDTGASVTCVDPAVLKALQLTPTGSTHVHTPSSGTAGKV